MSMMQQLAPRKRGKLVRFPSNCGTIFYELGKATLSALMSTIQGLECREVNSMYRIKRLTSDASVCHYGCLEQNGNLSDKHITLNTEHLFFICQVKKKYIKYLLKQMYRNIFTIYDVDKLSTAVVPKLLFARAPCRLLSWFLSSWLQ